MPSTARRSEERWQPSLADRLKQSQEDRKARGARKLKAVPQPKYEPVEMYYPTQITLNSGTTTQIFNTIITSNSTDTITINTAFGGTVTMNNGTAWRVWTSNDTTAGTTACDHVETWNGWYQNPVRRYDNEWGRWVDTPIIRVTQEVPASFNRFRVTETEEEKKRRLDEEARWRREEEERQKAIAAANTKAMDLLNSCLSKEQRECLKNNKYFFVKARSGRLYRIDEGSHGNVKVIDQLTKKVTERLCIQPEGLPIGDSMLAQKLFIEAAEDVFRQHANITLADGKVIHGVGGLLTGDKVLAPVIPIRRAA